MESDVVANLGLQVSLGYRLKHDGHYMGEVASMLVGSRNGYGNFREKRGKKPFPAHSVKLNNTPHAPCAVVYLVTMLIVC